MNCICHLIKDPGLQNDRIDCTLHRDYVCQFCDATKLGRKSNKIYTCWLNIIWCFGPLHSFAQWMYFKSIWFNIFAVQPCVRGCDARCYSILSLNKYISTHLLRHNKQAISRERCEMWSMFDNKNIVQIRTEQNQNQLTTANEPKRHIEWERWEKLAADWRITGITFLKW